MSIGLRFLCMNGTNVRYRYIGVRECHRYTTIHQHGITIRENIE